MVRWSQLRRTLLAGCWVLVVRQVDAREAQAAHVAVEDISLDTYKIHTVEDISLDSAAGVASWTLSSSPVAAADAHIGTVSVPALVPGDVGDDLERAGILPDLWVADNSLEEPWWVPTRTWTYTASFTSPTAGKAAAVELRFEGVDYNATIALNGKTLGSHAGSFLPIYYPVGSLLDDAEKPNVLTVTIHPPTDESLIAVLYNGSTPMYGLDHCKQRREMPYWKSVLNQWDFATKYYQIGIWRSVSLHLSPASGATLQPLPMVLPHLVPPYSSATLELRAHIDVGQSLLGKQLKLIWNVVCLTDSAASSVVVNTSFLASSTDHLTTVNASAVLVSPRLWWPNGYGPQHRYMLELALISESGALLDSTNTKFGIRHLENLENDHEPFWEYNRYGAGGCGPCLWNSSHYPECNRTDGGHRNLTCDAHEAAQYPSPSRWLFSVNGRRVFARGGNWVPGDLAFGRLVREKQRFHALLQMAHDLGYTYIRVWGGGLIEDQQFYDYCDEFGILVQQDFPLAGCGFAPGGANESDWDWLYTPVIGSNPQGSSPVSVISAFEQQLPVALRQLVNHPSVVRYTLGNELYENRTQCPVEKVFEDTLRALDQTRMTRQADPTTVGQRHGPYHFDVAGGSGYDAWGGRWPESGSCHSANFNSVECCNGGTDLSAPGCRYNTHDGGPGDPFEWSEFGSNAISDIQTLRHVMPAASLTPATVGDAMWGVHKAGMWLDQALWTAVFAPSSSSSYPTTDSNAALGSEADQSASPFSSMEEIVGISQWVQAEAYRYAYQAGRRRKWHRSLMASWTFDEPWPNAAHGCVIDYYGIAKHAYYTVKQSMQMMDVSLSYSNIHQASGEQLKATVWVDSELADAKQCVVNAQYFTVQGKALGTEQVNPPGVMSSDAADVFQVPAATATKLSQLNYIPAPELEGNVIIVRLALLCVTEGHTLDVFAQNDYTFGIMRSLPSSKCNIEAGFDWHPDAGTVVAAKDSEACCAACEAKAGCKVGVLFDGECFLKSATEAMTKYARAGYTTCSPKTNAAKSVVSEVPASVESMARGGPLRAMLGVAKTNLSLTIVGTNPAAVLHIANANMSGSPCALYVKPSLRNSTGHQIGYASFSNGFVILRPGETAMLQVMSAGPVAGAAVMACAEAWNAPRVCEAFPHLVTER